MKNVIVVLSILFLNCKTHSKETVKTIEKSEVEALSGEKCMQERIAAFKKNTQCKTGSAVKSYIFQEQLVYVFEEGNCGADMTASVYHENCTKLGDLGGFVGNTKINGVSFSEAVFQEVVWQQKVK